MFSLTQTSCNKRTYRLLYRLIKILISMIILLIFGLMIARRPIEEPRWPLISFNHPFSNNDGLYQTKRLPQALIIGSRKSGTRALLKFLELNPAIRPSPKEVHFFDRQDNYKLGLSWYRDQMPPSDPEQITMEKSPSYFVTDRVPQLVADMNSTIKLILIFRDPVIRLISDFSQLVSNRIESLKSNETSVRKEDIDETWATAAEVFERHVIRPDGSLNENWRPVRIGMYSVHLENWLKVFPIEQFHFVDGETFIEDPFIELHQVEKFLEVKPTISRFDFVYDKKKRFHCIALNRTSDEPSKTNNRCLSGHKGRRHIAVKESIILKLRQFYSPYNEYLFSLIGKHFNWN